MKNKYLKYSLTLIVCAIWGKIIYNYVGSFQKSGAPKQLTEKKEIPQSIRKNKSQYNLELNYKDPFDIEIKSSAQPSQKQSKDYKTKKRDITPKKELIFEPILEYKGLIKNTQSSKKIGLLLINNQSHFIYNSYTFESIQILSFDASVCSYRFNGKTKTVSK